MLIKEIWIDEHKQNYVYILDAPVVRISTSNEIVKEGDMIELSCFYHAYPTNISFIRWYFHNFNLKLSFFIKSFISL